MKALFTFILGLVAVSATAQNVIDENGRPIGSKPSLSVSAVEDVRLKKLDGVSSAELILEYSLPKGENIGQIILFHPKQDEALKTYDLSSEDGTVSVNLKDLPISTFAVGLYEASGKLIKSLNVH